jgi:hypothetical protein
MNEEVDSSWSRDLTAMMAALLGLQRLHACKHGVRKRERVLDQQ